MSNIAILTQYNPWPINDGCALRVINLSKQLASKHDCSLVYFSSDENEVDDILDIDIYSNVKKLPVQGLSKISWRRHLRVTEEKYIKLAYPEYYKCILDELRRFLIEHNIDIVISIGLYFAQFLDDINSVKKVMDDYDCLTLTIEREYEVNKRFLSIKEKVSHFIALNRIINMEKNLTKKYDLVTTISPTDLSRISALNNVNESEIELIPNGVSDELLQKSFDSIKKPNSIAFWGYLDFMPNKTAVEYFCEEIFIPFLLDKGVKWYVIGKNPSDLIVERAAQYENIIITGFIDDIFEFVNSIPVMVNPMVMGSGLKNKVLEALILSMAVVSTEMGVEALLVNDNEHCLIRDNPEDFAKAIILLLENDSNCKRLGNVGRQLVVDQYTWSNVGGKLNDLIETVV